MACRAAGGAHGRIALGSGRDRFHEKAAPRNRRVRGRILRSVLDGLSDQARSGGQRRISQAG